MEASRTVSELNSRFGIPGIVELVEGNGGLPKVSITSPAAQGEMYLHGAHVTSWKPTGTKETLFVSKQSIWEDGRPIRGGVPICFPWFGNKSDDPKAPAHGFARTRRWQLESIEQHDDAVTVSMCMESDEETKKWWPADFRLVHRASFGSELSLELLFTNTGVTSLHFEEALHTYYEVGDIKKVRLSGLDSNRYLDKTDANREKVQPGEIAITSETDRVYLNTGGAVEVPDPVLGRRITIAKTNSLTTVIWNPWAKKAQAMSDFGDEEWTQMVCVEVCNVNRFAVEVGPGQQHAMKATTTVGGL